MGPRQNADLAADLADLVGAPPVGPDALVEDGGAHRLLELRLERLRDVAARIGKALLEGANRLVLQLVERGLARGLVRVACGPRDPLGHVLVHGVDDVLGYRYRRVLHRRLSGGLADLPLPT